MSGGRNPAVGSAGRPPEAFKASQLRPARTNDGDRLPRAGPALFANPGTP